VELTFQRAEAELRGPAWRIIRTSVRGSSHEKRGQPCQDANDCRLIAPDWVALAVADGAGSAAHSDVGAQTAAACAVTVLSDHMRAHLANEKSVNDEAGWRAVMDDVLRASQAAVRKEAEIRGVPVRELASTLLVVLLGPDLTLAVQVGDGATVVQFEDGEVTALTRPQPGEYINEATFLTASDALKCAQFALRPVPVRSAAVLTDGLQMLALEHEGWTPHRPFFQPLFDFVEGQTDSEAVQAAFEEIMTSPRVRSRTDDDLTLVVATRESTRFSESTEAPR
jgi:hypothetical protein